MKTYRLLAALALASATAHAQTPPWTVTLNATLDPLPVGMCGAVRLTLFDPATRDVPRNPQGNRITIADFDMTVSGGSSAAGRYIDAYHYDVCGCPGGVGGATATVTATYPAKSLPAAARLPNVSFQQSDTFTLAPPKGSVIPAVCANLAAATPGAASNAAAGAGAAPGAAASGEVKGQAPANNGAGAAPAGQVSSSTGVPISGTTSGQTLPSGASAAGRPNVINPYSLKARVIGDQVELQFSEMEDAAFYVAFGPGLTQGGQRVEQLGVNDRHGLVNVFAANVPVGTHEWRVASVYADNAMTPPSEWTRTTATVVAPPPAPTPPASPPPSSTPPASPPPATSAPPSAPAATGKYLVTLVGIRAYQASADDMLSRDGVGDEVYASAYIRRYNRSSGALEETLTRRSTPHGDITHFANQRLQAGTRSHTGGIQDGDMIPDGPMVAVRNVPAQPTTFPLRLWEGTLTDGVEALVISPSLWEQDAGENFYNQWLQYQHSINVSLFAKQALQQQITEKRFDDLVLGMSGNDGGPGIVYTGLLSASSDRPLGLVANGLTNTALPNHTVVLTREIIETALTKPALGSIPSPVANAPSGGLLSGMPAIARIGVAAPKPGIIVVKLEDRNNLVSLSFPERPAIYQLFIQVERIP